LDDGMNQDVVEVQCLGGTRLRLTFDRGEVRELDIAALTPFDGVFSPLRDPAYFRQVRVNPDVGTIVWPNGADFCPDVLYERSAPVADAGASAKRGRAV
jgi:Protein of unknown function (DUF2442)